MRIAARVRTPRGGAVVRAVKPRGSGRVWPAPFTAAALGRVWPAPFTAAALGRGGPFFSQLHDRTTYPRGGGNPALAASQPASTWSIAASPTAVRGHAPAATIQFRHRHREPVGRHRLQSGGTSRRDRTARRTARASKPPSNPPSTPSLTPPTRSHSSPSSCTAGQASTRAPNSSAVRAPRARNRKLTRIPQLPSPLQLGQQLVLVRRPAGVPDAGQAGRVEARELGESGRRCASRRPAGRRIERHQVLGGVDQLAVQRPVVVAADPTWRATCYATSCSTSRRM